jgi:large subunit ribosomal protein L29
MAFPKMSELLNLTDQEIGLEILGVKRELFALRMKQATRQPVKPHEFKYAKHRLGQLMTLEHERKSITSHSLEVEQVSETDNEVINNGG